MRRKLCLPGRERRTNPVYCAVSNRMVPGVHVDASADSASAPHTEGASVPKQAVLPRDAGYNAGNSVLYGPTFTPVGHLMGLTALPATYFGFLLVIVLMYLLLVTLAKNWYIRKHHELL